MPLRCVDPDAGAVFHAFDLAADEWGALIEENRRRRHLRMPCCSAQVTLRRSTRGTQFFAHKAVGECVTAPETEAHLRLKAIAVRAAREHGWHAQTEVKGITASGEPWVADVLATKGKARVAIEIQWSGQTEADTVLRQSRYAASGVRALWLMRKLAAPLSEAVPAAQVSENDGRFTVVVPTLTNDQVLPIEEFLAAAFRGRLKFGLPVGAWTTVSAVLARTRCWRCGTSTRVVSNVQVQVGPHEFDFSVAETEDFPGVFDVIYRKLEAEHHVGTIKHRYSRTQRRSYLSNGCSRCDALFGQFHEQAQMEERQTVCVEAFPLDARWRMALLDYDAELGWAIFDFGRPSGADRS